MNMLVTNAGLAALVNAEATGTDTITISQIKFGSGQYTPTKTQTAMKTPFKTLTALSGGAVSANTLHVTAEDASTETYSVYEVGVFLSDGTLFAVGSQTTPILEKAAASIALLSVDIALADHSAATVTVGDTNFFNPQATTETKGVVELATADETKAGTDSDRAVTPASLKAELDVRDSKVVHTTGNETIAGTKTFTSAPAVKNGSPFIYAQNTDAVKGTAPSIDKYMGVSFIDSEDNNISSRLAIFETCYSTSGDISSYFGAYKPEHGSTVRERISVVYPADGSPYATAPTPADANDSSTKIATTAWVQTLAGKYLPLAGGTMTGTIKSTVAGALGRDTNEDEIQVNGGKNLFDGASIIAYGSGRSDFPGYFRLRAATSTSNVSDLIGDPGGTLKWANKHLVRTVNSVSADAAGNVVIEDVTGNAGTATKLATARTIALSGDVSGSATFDGSANVTISATVADDSHSHSNYLPLAGGSMTGVIGFENNAEQKIYVDSDGDLVIGDTNGGALLRVRGNNSTANSGGFQFRAQDEDNGIKYLIGKADGTLTWNSKNVLTSDNETTLKYLIDETQFSVTALGKSFNYGLLWLCVENFEDTADVNTSIGAGGSVADYYDATNHLIVKTGTGSIVLQSKSQTCSKNNATAWAYPDWTGSGSLKVEISRDGGTTFTTVASDTMTSISTQPTGTSMVCRLTLTGQVTLKNIAWGCK